MRTLAALTWEPQIKGALYVLIAIVVLPGSAYMLLATNVGSRLGFQLAAAGLFGWMTVMGSVWWVYGQGPLGEAPSWKLVEVVSGDLEGAGRADALAEYPDGWKKLDLADRAVADAQPVVDGELVGSGKAFKDADDFVLVAAAAKGGERYGPLGLDFRPFNVFHKPHYLVIQVQKAIEPPGGGKAVADPQAQPEAVVLVRDLGNVRRNPAVVTISCGLIFGLLVYALHTRDKEAAEPAT